MADKVQKLIERKDENMNFGFHIKENKARYIAQGHPIIKLKLYICISNP